MSLPPFTSTELPPGISAFLHGDLVSLVRSWSSARGHHTIRTEIPLSWWVDPEHTEKLSQALSDFRFAIGTEMDDESAR